METACPQAVERIAAAFTSGAQETAAAIGFFASFARPQGDWFHMATKKSSGKRELIKPKGDARYVKRSGSGQFKESDDVGRSLKKDREKQAKKTVKPGYGDQGDQKKRATKKSR